MTARKGLTVTRDSDGGLTIHDPQSDLVVSLIASHPDASGPRGLVVEVYDYRGRDVLMEDARVRYDADGEAIPLRLVVAHHPTVAYYPANEKGGEE